MKINKNLNVSFNSSDILTCLKFNIFLITNQVILNISHHANIIVINLLIHTKAVAKIHSDDQFTIFIIKCHIINDSENIAQSQGIENKKPHKTISILKIIF